MNKKLPSFYNAIKASVLLLCLGFMIASNCSVQKLLLSAIPVNVETPSSQKTAKAISKNNLTCSYQKEIVKTPLVELTKKSNSNTLYFVLLSTILYLFTSFVRKKSGPFIKNRVTLASPVPLFLKNQVFII